MTLRSISNLSGPIHLRRFGLNIASFSVRPPNCTVSPLTSRYSTTAAIPTAICTLKSPVRFESPISTILEDDAPMESPETRVDPATSLAFPATIRFKAPQTPPLTLVGLGVHTVGVSFVRIQAYAVGFYADLNDADLSGIDAERRVPWLIQNRTVAIRLAPTRYASFNHLRDGFVRALQGRLAEAHAKSPERLTDDDQESIQDSISKLSALSPSSNLQSKTPFYVVSSPAVEPRKTEIPALDGETRRAWVGVHFMRAYFTSDAPSDAMKRSVQEGVEKL